MIYLFVFYQMDPEYFLNPMIFWSSLIIPVIAMIKATRKERDEGGGKIEKIAAIRTSFIVWVLAMVIFHIFIFLMFQFDESLTELLREMMREARGDKAAKEVSQLTFGQAFFRMSFMLLPGFLFSYMVASFLKK